MADYIMTAAEVADMNRDYVDNADADWRIKSMVDADRDYSLDRELAAELADGPAYDGPDMCIFCDTEVFGTTCPTCGYKGIVSWAFYAKMGH